MRGRDEINNALAAGASYLPRARPIFPSPFPFLAPAMQANRSILHDTFDQYTTNSWPIFRWQSMANVSA